METVSLGNGREADARALRGGVRPLIDGSVLIVTKNRRDEVRRAVASALAQTCRPEVIVIDDASTDGTPELLEREFPNVPIYRSERSEGYIVQRNIGVELARAPIVVLLDDDAVFESPRTVEQTLLDFDDDRVGAVAIPHVHVGISGPPPLRAPADAVLATSEFVGTAAAVRRDVFLQLGGFRESIFHQGEERDFCIRLLATGSFVRVGRADPICHYLSLHRDLRRMDLYGRRNTILNAWYNEPFPSVLVRIAEMSAQGLVFGIRVGRPGRAVRGLLLGYRACWQERRNRRPVPRATNRLFRRLWKRGPLPVGEIAPLLETSSH